MSHYHSEYGGKVAERFRGKGARTCCLTDTLAHTTTDDDDEPIERTSRQFQCRQSTEHTRFHVGGTDTEGHGARRTRGGQTRPQQCK